MAYENIRLDIQDGQAILKIERPKALNALNAATLGELEAALREVSKDERLRILIITGAGEKAFVAGADISEMATMTTAQARQFLGTGYFTWWKRSASRRSRRSMDMPWEAGASSRSAAI